MRSGACGSGYLSGRDLGGHGRAFPRRYSADLNRHAEDLGPEERDVPR